MEIRDAVARKVLDSRGNWTIEMDLQVGRSWSRASVPAGKSRGKHEAVQFNAEKSIKKFRDFRERIVGRQFSSQEKLDIFLNKVAGVKKDIFGVDLVLAASIAFYRARLPKPKKLPTPMFNIINGGLHAGNGLAIQEFMVVPRKFESFHEKLEAGVSIYHELKKILAEKFGKQAVNVGDEGGFAPPLSKTEEALTLLEEAIGSLGLLEKVSISVDCAASSYYRSGKYQIDGKSLSPSEYIDHLAYLSKSFHLFSVEDPMQEEDFRGFSRFMDRSSVRVVGDDLTVTDLSRAEKAFEEKSINTVLIKPNQIGTITDTIKVIDFCRHNGWSWIMSHRSGETEDSFIADFAAATGTPFIKAGAPCRGERTAKYNQLLRLEEML